MSTNPIPVVDSDLSARAEEAVRSLVMKFLPELKAVARDEIAATLNAHEQKNVDATKQARSLIDRALEAEAVATELAVIASSTPKGPQSDLVNRWNESTCLLDAGEGLLGKAVESALVLFCMDNNKRGAWLRKRGWVRSGSGPDTWTDHVSGGAMSRSDAIKVQVQRDLKPFDFILAHL